MCDRMFDADAQTGAPNAVRTTAEWEHDMQGPSDFELSRRKLLLGTAASVATTAAPSVAYAQNLVIKDRLPASNSAISKGFFNGNGTANEIIVVDGRRLLVKALRTSFM